MFLKVTKQGYDRDGAQFAHGYFLILMYPDRPMRFEHGKFLGWPQHPNPPVRAMVKFVRMKQLGHFIMGRIYVLGHDITLTGDYGDNGLICNVPEEVYQTGVPLPDDLYDAWNKGQGWNCAGAEAGLMHAWGVTLREGL